MECLDLRGGCCVALTTDRFAKGRSIFNPTVDCEQAKVTVCIFAAGNFPLFFLRV